MYTKKHYVESSEIDSRFNLKLADLFRIMQDVATEDAERLTIGKADTIDKGYFWVITRYAVTIYKYPKYLETINVSTYPQGKNKFIYPRNYIITSQSGETLITASATWLLIEKATRKIALHVFDDKDVPEEHVEGEEPNAIKVEVVDPTFVEERKVRYSDIDLNGHLNNTRYIEYIVDSLGDEFHKNKVIKHITINYDRELRSGDVVKLYRKTSDNIDYIQGKADDKNIFNVLIKSEKA